VKRFISDFNDNFATDRRATGGASSTGNRRYFNGILARSHIVRANHHVACWITHRDDIRLFD
jgi:hypothetical protein